MISQWMDQVVELGTTWISLMLLATWRALPLFLLVAGLTLAFRKKFAPSLHALLWTIVVARLLLPISVESSLSIHKPIDKWFEGSTGQAVRQSGAPATAFYQVHDLLPNVDSDNGHNAWVPTETEAPPVNALAWKDLVYATMLGLAISVTLVLLLRGALSHLRFAIRLRSCRLLKEQQLIDMMLRECDSLAVGRRPALREVPSLAAPAVFGLVRHTICLPSGLIDTLDERELRWVLRHELAHLRRRDIPVMIAASIAAALHWFNPVVWFVKSRLRAAMEAAADRSALESLAHGEVAAYGNLLLRLAEQSAATKSSPTLGLISFASGKLLKQRVELLMSNNSSHGRSVRLLSIAFAAGLAGIGLTDAREFTAQKIPELNLLSNATFQSQAQASWIDPLLAQEEEGPAFIKEYDVASLLECIPQSLRSHHSNSHQLLMTWLMLPASLGEKLQLAGPTLSAKLSERQHQLLHEKLKTWSNGEPEQITVEARIIRTDLKTASSIDWSKQRIEGLNVQGLGPAIAARIGEREFTQFMHAVLADRESNIVFAPKVTLFDGQTASVADQVQRPFVTNIDSKADGITQPVISILDEGIKFVLTPNVNDDASLTLAFELRTSAISKVSYAHLPIRLSDRADCQTTVQVPATEQYDVSSSVKLALGESVVVAIPRVFNLEPGADAETTLIVALTPRIIDRKQLASAGDSK